jgi:branched-subunit amino acid aminotransferase/4-amino-4-deoxychorismate lyase
MERVVNKMIEKGFSKINHTGMSHDGRYYFDAIINNKAVKVKACSTRNIIFVKNQGEWVVV